ncbi:Hypothetical predicted protein [Lecanosticta acicola]|uniref:Uncharacterized protein n=1 Tax=Lecanosticta acicola TaxID=111012 RepID=A0AAI8YUC5_9PEZI|nr:Hypothetical predicted protein [Lecanosticta acicola]
MPFQKFSHRLQKDNSPPSNSKNDKNAHEDFKRYLEHKTDDTKIRWLRECLDERSSQFVIKQTSLVLTDKVGHAETLIHWIVERDMKQPACVHVCSTTAEKDLEDVDESSQKLSNIEITSDLQNDHYTHAIFRIVQKPEAPKTLNLLHQALAFDGVALIESLKRNPTLEVHLKVLEMQKKGDDQAKQETVERVRETVGANNFDNGELADLAVKTGFEREKVRSFPKRTNIEGEKLEKWTTEVKAQMSCGKYPELEPWVDKAIKHYMEENGGMAVETELLVVTK